MTLKTPGMTRARVFISYAWEGDNYRFWVRRLATRLRNDGIDARLDHWHLKEGESIPQFMNREVRLAAKVLVLCSPKYRESVHATEEGMKVTGAGWEAMLVTSEVFSGQAEGKVVAVLSRGGRRESAPSFLASHPMIDLTNPDRFEDQYRELLRRLAGKTDSAPDLGFIPENLEVEPVAPLTGTDPAAWADTFGRKHPTSPEETSKGRPVPPNDEHPSLRHRPDVGSTRQHWRLGEFRPLVRRFVMQTVGITSFLTGLVIRIYSALSFQSDATVERLRPTVVPYMLMALGLALAGLPSILPLVLRIIRADRPTRSPLPTRPDSRGVLLILSIQTALLLLFTGVVLYVFRISDLPAEAFACFSGLTAKRRLAQTMAIQQPVEELFREWARHPRPEASSGKQSTYPYHAMSDLTKLLDGGSQEIYSRLESARSDLAPGPQGGLAARFFGGSEPSSEPDRMDRAIAASLVGRLLVSDAGEGKRSEQIDEADKFFTYGLTLVPELPVAKNGRGVCALQSLLIWVANSPPRAEWDKAHWRLVENALVAFKTDTTSESVDIVEGRKANNILYLEMILAFATLVREQVIPVSLPVGRSSWLEALKEASTPDGLIQKARKQAKQWSEPGFRVTLGQALLLKAAYLTTTGAQSEDAIASATAAVEEATSVILAQELGELRPKLLAYTEDPDDVKRVYWGIYADDRFQAQRRRLIDGLQGTEDSGRAR